MLSTESNNRITKLSIIIPVFNEIRTLRTLLERVLSAPLPCDREIVIVDESTGRLAEGRKWRDGIHQSSDRDELRVVVSLWFEGNDFAELESC